VRCSISVANHIHTAQNLKPSCEKPNFFSIHTTLTFLMATNFSNYILMFSLLFLGPSRQPCFSCREHSRSFMNASRIVPEAWVQLNFLCKCERTFLSSIKFQHLSKLIFKKEHPMAKKIKPLLSTRKQKFLTMHIFQTPSNSVRYTRTPSS
jgi:hypothetical protein